MLRAFLSAYNFLTFGHVGPLIQTGRKRTLEESDIPELPEEFVSKKFHVGFDSLPRTSPAAFCIGIAKLLRREVTIALGWNLLRLVLAICSPYFIHKLLSAFAAGSEFSLSHAILYALGLTFSAMASAVAVQHFFYHALKSELHIVSGVNALIYKHALKLSRNARVGSQTGDVVNHMSTDSDSVSEILFVSMDIVYSVVLAIVVMAMLWNFLGLAAVAGVVVLACMTPISRYVARSFLRYDEKIMAERDGRVSLMSQILSGIRIVKYFCWARLMEKEVLDVRTRELEARKKLINNEALAMLLYASTTTAVCVVAFGTFLALGQTLTAATVFASIALFKLLEEPFGNISHQVAVVVGARVAAARILAFLKKENCELNARQETPADLPVSVSLKGVSSGYGSSSSVLNKISLTVGAGESVAVVGPVGAGKSTLLLTLLGELQCEQGEVQWGCSSHFKARLAFVPQEAFVLNTTLENNILFGENCENIESLLRDCALERDVALLQYGLKTEIGEHGVNLSGGQKQRVGLARAAAKKPGVVLLDDPLSAVDFNTEDTLVEKLIFGRWKHITRVVVTHRLAHLVRFDKVVFVKDGQVVSQGSLSHLLATCVEFRRFFDETLREESREAAHSEVNTPATEKPKEESGNARLTVEEDRERGAVPLSTYKTYLSALCGGKVWTLVAMIAVTCTAAALPILQNGWLSVWTNAIENVSAQKQDLFQVAASPYLNVAVYGLLGAVVLAVLFVERRFWLGRALKAGRDMHDKALRGVLNAPVRFFDANPQGRILNRFSRDVDNVDRHLPWSFQGTVNAFVHFLAAVVLIVSLLPVVVVALVPVLALYYKVQLDYRASAREAKRFEALSRSPRYAHFKETLGGLTVIRAFGKQDFFIKQFFSTLELNQRMFHGQILLNRWFSIRVPMLSAGISLMTCVGVVFAVKFANLGAGTAGLLLSYALGVWGSLNWGVRAFSEAEAKMTAVERLLNFSKLEAEVNIVGEPLVMNDMTWPTCGTLVFEGVALRYAKHLPLTLRDVSFEIEGGTRVGIIGRTGAGKSTIFQALYRFVNLEKGRILLDGCDISRIPLDEVRRNIAIIPQDPTLFLGSLRSNLDRFVQYSDEQIWSALERSCLKEFVASLPQGLDAKVEENGHNFSQGQRQLFCLARALLCNAKVVVMDEATASVDIQTDRQIQATIRTACAGTTLLIIAHRYETIADCDKIIELSDGRVLSEKRNTPNVTYAGVTVDSVVNAPVAH